MKRKNKIKLAFSLLASMLIMVGILIGFVIDTVSTDNEYLVHVQMKDETVLLCVPENELSLVSDNGILKRNIKEWGKGTLLSNED